MLKIKVTMHMALLVFMVVVLSCTGELDSFSDTNSSKIVENINQGNVTLFSQNYSETNNVPNNIFIAKIQNSTISEGVCSTIYGIEKSEILLEGTPKELKYKITRNSSLVPYSVLSVADTIACFGINEYAGHLKKPIETYNFCKCTSIPIIYYLEEPRQIGSLYICDLTPMVKCAYEISMDMNADDHQSFVELDSPGSKLIIQEIDNKTVLKSYFKNVSGNIRSESICIGNAAEKSNFEIIFDGDNKINTIRTKNGSYIVTPFYSLDRQKLPYVDFSNGYIKFTSFVMGKGTYLDVSISNINQKADRKFITPIGDSKMLPFGLDGPYPRNTTEQGINYLNSKGDRGTIWFDVRDINRCNKTDLEYLRNLVNNNSWDTGIHYSKELESLPLKEAYKVMDGEYSYVYEKIGRKPTSWCSMRNRDNITHATYAYEKLGMLWRNGDSGIHAERDVGNLYDDTWEWWEPASQHGMIYPVFTHQLDKDPAIKYSISSSKFKAWVDNYDSNNIPIVSFYEYNQINRNTFDAYFDNLEQNKHFVTFDAHTNGARALINVNISAGNNTQVYDSILDKPLNFKLEQDKSITFWAENNHTYKIRVLLNSLSN